MSQFRDTRLEDGRARLVRHGFLPEREMLADIGPALVKVLCLRGWANSVHLKPRISNENNTFSNAV